MSDRSDQNLNKIKPIEELPVILATQKAQGATIVLCHGVFELLHSGHMRQVSAAKRHGDIVVVIIEADQNINKGPGRPVFNEKLRSETVAGMKDVDFVAVNKWQGATHAIRLLKPNIYIRGYDEDEESPDSSAVWEAENAAAQEVGATIETVNGVSYSSSKTLNELIGAFPPEVDLFLQQFRSRFGPKDIAKALSELHALRVLVIGEAILDEYVYGDTLGKSAKEPIIALRYLSSETHAGGSLVIANHLAEFCRHIDLVSYLGEENTREDFIRKSLKHNVHAEFVFKADSPTIVKRRFVEKYLVTKLLEVYEINDAPLQEHEEELLCKVLEPRLEECDVVIVADYGHGLVTQKIVDLLCRKAPFLAVNTQINAANAGYHTISRFPRADYVCLHEGEVRLDQRDRTGDIHSLVKSLSNRMGCDLVMVTRGKHGSLLYQNGQGFSECPAFAVKVVDRVGAGDSVLAISTLCAAKKMPLDMIGFISNMVAAQAVGIVGNRTAIDKDKLVLSIEGILR
jgi:rfaE bifunctional protein kinase chain/domain